MLKNIFDFSAIRSFFSPEQILGEKVKAAPGTRRIFICAGEPSGDLHAANLVREIFKKDQNVEIHGIGGHLMAREGANIIIDCEGLAVMGITDVAAHWKVLSDAFSKACAYLSSFNPDIVILVDYPGFNLRLARKASELGIRVFYYISPKIWAWGAGRVEKIKKYVDHMGLILPFEEEFYRRHGVNATFVGNPLMDDMPEPIARKRDPGSQDDLIIGFLPGSRAGEISRHLPVMLESALLISRLMPEARFVLSMKDKAHAEEQINAYALKDIMEVETGDVRRIFEKSDLLVAASGTVTLEAAIAGVPTVIIYRMSELSYKIARKLVRVEYAGLANLIAGRGISPELLQSDANPSMIAKHVTDLLQDPEKMERMRSGFMLVRKKLGRPGAAFRAANLVFGLLDGKTKR